MNTSRVPDEGRTELDLGALVAAIDIVCHHRQISALKASREIGIRPEVISNMRRRVKPNTDNTTAILAWLHADVTQFMRPRQPASSAEEEDCGEEVIALPATA